MPTEPPRAERFLEVGDSNIPVICRGYDYPAGYVVLPHTHAQGQLIYAVHGVMTVSGSDGLWIVPPTRGIWMPAGAAHEIRCVSEVHMRCVYVSEIALAALPRASKAVGVSPLLRELILATAAVPEASYPADSRNGRLVRLLLDELHTLPELPLHLPQPADARLALICARLRARPDDGTTLEEWSSKLAVAAKTIQRAFVRETGMTFGKWRQQARLLHGLERLATGQKVVDVALALGYDSPSAFATMFRRHFGKAPSDFFR